MVYPYLEITVNLKLATQQQIKTTVSTDFFFNSITWHIIGNTNSKVVIPQTQNLEDTRMIKYDFSRKKRVLACIVFCTKYQKRSVGGILAGKKRLGAVKESY